MQESHDMTLGSLFDGIGGWLLAALHAGITPVWASEIEPFPCSVTARHFPDVKQLGDITKIDPDTLTPVDIICAGSPCQDLSIAGKRKGLDGERSGLFKTAISIFHQLRERRGRPRFFVDVIRPVKDGKMPTLTARMGTEGHNVPIVNAYCIAGNTIDRKIENGGNWKGVLAETAYTLNTIDRHAVATIYGAKSYGEYERGKVAALRASGGNYGGGSENLALSYSVVRRLTPTECERLHGLEDGYTDIEFNGKPSSDSKRYEAIGNGMAQPCADYVIRRIKECVQTYN